MGKYILQEDFVIIIEEDISLTMLIRKIIHHDVGLHETANYSA